MLTLNGYTDFEIIFHSTSSLVCRATSVKLARRVILKRSILHDAVTNARLRHEAEITSLYSNEFVSKLLAVEEEKTRDRLWLVFEDSGMHSLRDVQDKQQNLDDFLGLALLLCQGLMVIEQAGIIHGDISPGNIIVSKDFKQAKYIDFGTALRGGKTLHQVEINTEIEGTLPYIAPEKSGRINRRIDHRADIYSLGALLYEVLTGQTVFKGENTLEYIYALIAQKPIPPHERKSGIDPQISSIILKTLEKNPEDRYQTPKALFDDLYRCQSEWNSQGHIETFSLAASDGWSRFSIPQKLYGREAQLKRLTACFEESIKHAPTFMLVSGYSGIGKSSLIGELYKPITEQRAKFVSTKFDQYQTNVPFSGLIDIFSKLVRSVLVQADATVGLWREKLSNALGENAKIMLDLVPSLAAIFPTPPVVKALCPVEEQNRLRSLMHKMLLAFAESNSPLVIFLDDLQWIDLASLDMLYHLLGSAECGHMFVIGAYRSNEVSTNHPLTITLENMRKIGVKLETIELVGLSENHVAQLINDACHSRLDELLPLSKCIHQKTQGNPFFTYSLLQNLVEGGEITFDQNASRWTYNLSAIDMRGISNNVVDLLTTEIKRLPHETHVLLATAASLGSAFTTEVLSAVCARPQSEVHRVLLPAVNAGMLLVTGSKSSIALINSENPEPAAMRFVHDKVQEASKALLDDKELPKFYLGLARRLYAHVKDKALDQYLFDIVSLWNQGLGLVEDASERDFLMDLNFAAGLKNLKASAFSAARNCFASAAKLSEERHWQTRFETMFDLHLNLAKTELLNAQYATSESMFNALSKRAKSNDQKLEIFENKIFQYTLEGRHLEALKVASEALKIFGVSYIPNPKIWQVLPSLLLMAIRLKFTRIESIIERPTLNDSNMLSAMGILSQAATSSYILGPFALVQTALKIIQITLKHGNAPVSAFAFALMSFVEAQKLRDFKMSERMIKLAYNINEKFSDSVYRCKVRLVNQFFLQHMTYPVGDALLPLEEAFQSGLAAGDYNYAGYCLIAGIEKRLFVGVPLNEVLQKSINYAQFTSKVQDRYSDPIMTIGILFSGEMAQSNNPHYLKVKQEFDESAFVSSQRQSGYLMGLSYYLVYMAILAFHREDYRRALALNLEADRYVPDNLIGQVSSFEHYFYKILILCAADPSLRSVKHRLQCWMSLRKLRSWVSIQPSNYRPRLDLAMAVYAAARGKAARAEANFKRAFEAFAQNGMHHLCAVTQECWGRWLASRGEHHQASLYLHGAHHAYSQWGAILKVTKLEEELSINSTEVRAGPVETTTFHASTRRNGSQGLDSSTILNSALSLGSEVNLESLIKRLMELLSVNTGAQKVALILLDADDNLSVEHVWDQTLSGFQAIERKNILDAAHVIPVSMIQYVRRTGEDVLLADARQSELFAHDPYVLTQQLHSALCTSIRRQGRLIGLLYLENRMTKAAFSQERLKIVQLISLQTAISIENAKLYQNLERKVEERTSELHEKNVSLKAANERSRHLVRVLCHDLNNTITIIKMSAELLALAKDLPEKDMKFLKSIARATQTQQEIVTQVREQEAVQSGKKTVKLQAIQLTKILESAQFIFADRLKEKNITLKLQVDDALKILAEEISVTHNVFNNIISNAIKFTPAGGSITVSTRIEANYTILSVQDTGIGMPEELMKHLFMPDKKTSRLGTAGEEGTGFGMPIVKAYMESYGGKISVESRDQAKFPGDSGTSFHLFFRAAG